MNRPTREDIAATIISKPSCGECADYVLELLDAEVEACAEIAIENGTFISGRKILARKTKNPPTWCEHIAVTESERNPVRYWLNETGHADRLHWKHCPICGKARPEKVGP